MKLENRPVVAAVVLDGDLDLGDAGGAVEVRPAKTRDGAARVPGGDVVEATGGREREGRGRRGRIELERTVGGGLRVADLVAGADADGVVAVGGEVGGVEVVRTSRRPRDASFQTSVALP